MCVDGYLRARQEVRVLEGGYRNEQECTTYDGSTKFDTVSLRPETSKYYINSNY